MLWACVDHFLHRTKAFAAPIISRHTCINRFVQCHRNHPVRWISWRACQNNCQAIWMICFGSQPSQLLCIRASASDIKAVTNACRHSCGRGGSHRIAAHGPYHWALCNRVFPLSILKPEQFHSPCLTPSPLWPPECHCSRRFLLSWYFVRRYS